MEETHESEFIEPPRKWWILKTGLPITHLKPTVSVERYNQGG